MKIVHIAAAAGLGLLALAATPAFAAPVSGYVTANVNERSGPSTSYPPILVIPAGSSITIYGCLADDSWCDISWGPNRGWMSSAYLQASYQSRRIPIRDYSAIPFITFNFGSYWDSHYRNRPFFKQRTQWSNYHWQNGNNQNQGQNNQGQNQGSNNQPWPKPPNHMGDQNNGNPNYNNGQNSNNGSNGNGPGFGNGNGPKYGNGSSNGYKNKNCKWINGEWVCK